MSVDSSRGGDGGKPRSARPSKPTPVRALDDTPPARKEAPGPPPERVTFRVDDRSWTAEAVGHAESAGGVGVLLVRFTAREAADDGGETASDSEDLPEDAREAWVVGDHLKALPHARLAGALTRAGPWRGSETTAPFFAENTGDRG